jgi:hypothetical protein
MQDQVPTATLPPFASAERVDLVFVLDGRTLVHPLPAEGRVRIGRSVPDGVSVAHASLSRSSGAPTAPGSDAPTPTAASTRPPCASP